MLVWTIKHVINEFICPYNEQKIVIGPNEPEAKKVVTLDEDLSRVSQMMKSESFLEDVKKFLEGNKEEMAQEVAEDWLQQREEEEKEEEILQWEDY